MPLYAYKASDSSNHLQEGSLSANSQEEASIILKKSGLLPIKITQKQLSSQNTGTLPIVEKVTFCRYISTMLHSGLSLSEGLVILKQETKHPLMRQILDDLVYHLEQGQSLSNVFALYPHSFDPFFITLVKAGEVSGTLSGSFSYLESELRDQYTLSSKIKGALMYPAFVVVAMAGIGSLMIFFILPQIGEVFLKMTFPLPPLTRALFTTSIAVAKFRIPILIGLVISSICGFVFVKQPIGKKLLIRLLTPIPIINKLLRQIDTARFCRIFSTLIKSGVPVIECLTIALDSMSYPAFKRSSKDIIEQVSKGLTIAKAFHSHHLFPVTLTQMMAAGEKSGTLDETLHDLATFYEGEVEEEVKKATQLLEPIIMLVVGIGVGGMILSIIAPLYSVVGSMQATMGR